MARFCVILILCLTFFYSCKKDEIAPAAPAPIIAGMTMSTFVGIAGSFGSANGTGVDASFYFPYGITSDSSGNLFIADAGNNIIRKITPRGVVSTLAGTAGLSGSIDGTGAAARFNNPKGVVADSLGNIFVADSGNHTIRKITNGGVVTTFAGVAGTFGSINGTGTAARFFFPNRIAADPTGALYVTDTGNHIIRKITPAAVVTTFAGTAGIVGATDAIGVAASFNNPKGIGVDGSLNVYVSDSGNQTLRKITTTGIVTTLAGLAGSSGATDAVGSSARFNNPNGIAIDNSGNIIIADVGNHVIRRVTASGTVTTVIGIAGTIGADDGVGVKGSLSSPNDVAINTSGYIFVIDTGNNIIRKIKP